MTSVVPEETTLIVVSAAADDPVQATVIANAVAATATKVIPALQANDVGRVWVDVQQLRPAGLPSSPVSPDAKRVSLWASSSGCALGLALTISAQTLDTRIRRADDVRGLTDVPVLAEIRHRKRRGQQHALAVRDEPVGATGEAFRTLRTNLGFMEPRDRRSLVFAAVTPDKNDAQVPANLAWSLAQAGWSVLLVDLDLRRSSIAETIGVPSGKGLADVLLGKRNLAEVVNNTAEPRLRVVTAGTPHASPSDLLSGPAMNNLLRRMEQEYDYVILHAPPLLSYTDAALVSQAAGGSVVTVAAGRTRAQELTTAMTALANVRIKPAGLVLTGTRRLEGLSGLVGGGLGKRASGSGTSGSSGLPQPTDAGRMTSSTSVQSPSEATLRMMSPGPWPGGRAPRPGASTRPRPALRTSQPAQDRSAAVPPASARRDPTGGPPSTAPSTEVPWMMEPSVGAPSVGAPSVGAPSVKEATVESSAEEATVESSAEEATVESSVVESSVVESSVVESSVVESSVEESSVEESSLEEASLEEASLEEASLEEASLEERHPRSPHPSEPPRRHRGGRRPTGPTNGARPTMPLPTTRIEPSCVREGQPDGRRPRPRVARQARRVGERPAGDERGVPGRRGAVPVERHPRPYRSRADRETWLAAHHCAAIRRWLAVMPVTWRSCGTATTTGPSSAPTRSPTTPISAAHPRVPPDGVRAHAGPLRLDQ